MDMGHSGKTSITIETTLIQQQQPTTTTTTTTTAKSLVSSSYPSDDNDDEEETSTVQICFRNRTNDPLLLCWVGHDGTYHHYYTLVPFQQASNNKVRDDRRHRHRRRRRRNGQGGTTTNTMEQRVGWLRKQMTNQPSGRFNRGSADDSDSIATTVTDDDHLETSQIGHVFVIVATPAHSIATVQEQESFDAIPNVRIIGAYRANSHHDHNSDNIDHDESHPHQKIHLVEIIDPMDFDDASTSRDTTLNVARTSTNTANTKHGSLRQSLRNCIPCCQPKRKCKEEDIDVVDDDEEAPAAVAATIIELSNTYDRFVLTARLVRLLDSDNDEALCDTTNKPYVKQYLGKCQWPIMMEPKWYGTDIKSEDVLACDLDFMSRCLPPHAVTLLRDTNPTPIYVNKTIQYGPKRCPIRGHGMCYHPESDWLRQNGMNSDKGRSVELYQANEYRTMRTDWGMGGILVHEFSHAYHHKACTDGYDNQEIIDCYRAAMKEGIYDSVHVHGSQGPMAEAYAKTNAMEYFAELSTAFLGGIPRIQPDMEEDNEDTKEYVRRRTDNHDRKQLRSITKKAATATTTAMTTSHDHDSYNKWYPHNRQEIRHHDPRAYELLKKMWKINDDDDDNNHVK